MNTKQTTLSLAAALSAGLALSPTLVSADVSPFETAELTNGYMQVAEGNCGGNMPKDHGSKCDGKGKDGAEKSAEGKCGEAKCGAEMDSGADKPAEGKCGEGKCGGSK